MIRSQTIAPNRPAKITAKVTTATCCPPTDTVRSIIPLPMVAATAVPNMKAAAKLNTADQITALPGDSTRVETTVAIEFAAS